MCLMLSCRGDLFDFRLIRSAPRALTTGAFYCRGYRSVSLRGIPGLILTLPASLHRTDLFSKYDTMDSPALCVVFLSVVVCKELGGKRTELAACQGELEDMSEEGVEDGERLEIEKDRLWDEDELEKEKNEEGNKERGEDLEHISRRWRGPYSRKISVQLRNTIKRFSGYQC